MAFDAVVQTISVPAAADLTGLEMRFMTIGASGQMNKTGAGLMADGVLEHAAGAAGRSGSLAIHGAPKMIAGAAIAAGALVASDANGKPVTAVSGDQILGKTLMAASAAGDVIPVLLKLGAAEATKP